MDFLPVDLFLLQLIEAKSREREGYAGMEFICLLT